ncbi:MAG: cobyrinate a,c-diamide synthase, partial [Thiohalomonadales bacterium]
MSHILISAAHKSSGKTTISIGLCAALSKLGLRISPFKKGPDYIDPMWLSKASDTPCYNLDFHTMSHPEIRYTFQHYSQGRDLSIIEGNKGLYDGLDLNGGNSNAALAKLLSAPVILVIDAQGMTRGIAPLILGYQAFEPEINIAGIILNKLGGSRHEAKLRNVIEHYTNVPVIGAVHRDKSLVILERHLGLIPSNESIISDKHIANIAQQIANQVDLQRVISIGNSIETEQRIAIAPKPLNRLPARPGTGTGTPVKIAIARDAAFGFYYPEDISAFKKSGAELIVVDTLNDRHFPDVDALFIGGGFPETHLSALSGNASLRTEIRLAIDAGLPVYAECGGLMYLSRSIHWRGKT